MGGGSALPLRESPHGGARGSRTLRQDPQLEEEGRQWQEGKALWEEGAASAKQQGRDFVSLKWLEVVWS